MADPDEVLSSTDEKANFQRLTRLLICGGTILLREIFDKFCPPSDLPRKLSDRSTKDELMSYLTRPERDILYPSPGVYGESKDFDVSLLFRLLRKRKICRLSPPPGGWDEQPASGDHTLTADLVRIKYYRNSLYAHVKETMDIKDNDFQSIWSEMRDAFVRIAGNLSSAKKKEWQGAIDTFLTSPLTAEDKRNVDELKEWYLQDKEIKKSMEELKSSIENVERVVREESQVNRSQLEKLMREKLSSTATSAESQSGRATRLRLHIDFETLPASGSQRGETEMEVRQLETQDLIQHTQRDVTTCSARAIEYAGNGMEVRQLETQDVIQHTQRDVTTCRARAIENAGNSGSSAEKLIELIGSRYVNAINPSSKDEFHDLLQYLKEIRKVVVVDSHLGSLVLTVECNSLEILDKLWEDYCSGHLGKVVQKCLVSDDILNILGPTEVKVTTSINEEEYKACRQHFLNYQDVASTTEDCDDIGEPARKQRKLDTTETSKGKESSPSEENWAQPIIRSPRKQQKASDAGFVSEIFFALDCSSSVEKEEFQTEIEFARQMSNSWNPENVLEVVVVYGNAAETVRLIADNGTFSVDHQGLKTKLWRQTKGRRIDLALTEAANHFTSSANEHLVILITAGRQLSGEESKEDDQQLLVSATEALSSKNIKVILVPVGTETDYRELGLIARRPQYLFPLSRFDDMTRQKANGIASYIMETVDIESFAKKRLYTFPGVPQEAGLWENISLCSAVMEGAWYLFYDNKKKPSKSNTVKKFIRESIDSFHSTLVTESKICLSLAVFGNQGVGKSFFLNFLLNWGLPADQQVENGPLPSAEGGSQTPLPIYVKYGKRVKVLFHKQRKSDSPEIWFPEANLDKKSLEDVRNLLQIKFQELDQQGKSQDSNVKDETRVELQGPFPVFHGLKNREMTSSGQLELEVDVEFVDVPGYGAETGNDSISVELSKADVVLFFDSQLSGRPVSAEDIAAIFRKHDEFEFTRRPKLVHVVNDRKVPTSTSSCNIDLLLQQKKEDLSKAWALFLESSPYEDERGKVPQLSGEAVLEKLQDESEVVYFNPAADQCSILKSLKQVINQHVQHVMIKQAVHPFLQKVHLAATRLKTRICRIKTTEKRNNKAIEIKEEVSFQIKPDENEESELVASCITQTDLPLHYEDIGDLFGFLYEHFIYANETLDFLLNLLRRTLETFTNRLMYTLRNASWSTFKEAPSDLIEVAEILCESRVQQFCATSALAYLIDVLNKGKDRNPFTKKNQKAWSKANDEERKNLCRDFIYILLERTYESLEKETGERERRRKSHFTLCQLLKQDVKDLFAVQSLNDDADRRALLELLVKKLQEVIQFCHQTIYEINPHPSLNIRKSISLPTKMVEKDETSTVPIDSSHEKIVKEVKHLLLKPGRKAATDAIRKLETKLNCGKGGLELPRSHKVENLLWARVLINVLCDKDHFDIQLEDGFLLDQKDAEVEQLLVLARKRLLAYQKSCVTCRIMKQPSPSDDVILLRKSDHERYCLEVLISPKVSQKLDEILANFKDPSQSLAPIFIPSVRPGPTPEILGNYFLEEDPWSKGQRMYDGLKESDKEVLGEEIREENSSSVLNIFLVVEQHHLEIFKDTIDRMQQPPANNVNLMYVVLPQRGRGIGVTRAIIKSLAECFRFSLYWTIDDDIQFMYQFDGNSRRWYKCSITRGLQFGQRVFQTCLEKAVKDLNEDQRADLLDDATKDWEPWTKQIKRRANKLLVDDNSFSCLQRNPSLLHSPFAEAAKACGGDPDKEKKLKDYESQFVAECRKRIFDDTLNHIAGVSLAHETSKRYDYMSKYPKADYMCSEQRYQVVLHNAPALRGRNYVADEVLFSDEEFQVNDINKRDSFYWGTKGSAKSFSHTLKLSGVIGYQVIRVVHSHKKLADAFNRAQTKTDEDENENDDINMEADY